ncbi:FAD linked oxidase domain protein [Metallosphaera sedula]|uniref:FAD linked oxidase domain protein n=5 Tax=Metallosphaera TaxID=41980 RepID=A4YE76_METS5|nr:MULTISPECIES: FAD-linked oxidase C-terminal domain-containing protein [Metallosphaera]ABP94728.1 FAD linked oxidase domain protein [Metallosphaera sedula DSM 5348]AIM26715.1 FAD linked oxidase domain protein [Metallosphaera sedula]AKV73676.1 FAD-linked oxidase [Metallosphaera sedula]AKV75916.1 FAD-linked oxidase [Metallosphaera sedula]AKV78167.1 FAD-linked oxidase [Metallosphaera sedula]
MNLHDELASIVGDEWVITGQEAKLYSYDGFTAVEGDPSMVVLPGNEEEAIRVVRLLLEKGAKFVMRGTGTSLSGATVPLDGEVVVGMARLNRVYSQSGLEIEVGPGIANVMVTKNAPPHLFYAPDPSSYTVSSIGGNISHDSGGVHVVKYGPTVNSVLGVRVILPHGEVEDLEYGPFLSALPIFVGSEGTLGGILRARLRLFPKPATRKSMFATFDSVRDAGRAVVGIFKAGVIPSALEMMDRNTIRVVERSRYRANAPDVEALLLIELDGSEEAVNEQEILVSQVIKDNNGERIYPDDGGTKLWNARKGAFPAMGVVAPAYLTLDCNVPREALPDVLAGVAEIGRKKGVLVANVFHAGDGNLHPLIPYYPDKAESLKLALETSAEIMKLALRMGGVPSGEHGIGIEKLKYMDMYYTEEELQVQRRIKRTFDQDNLLNPCKLLGGCKPRNEVTRWMWEWD